MLDQTPPKLERTKGRAMAAFGLRNGVTRLADLAQEGSAKLLLPRIQGARPEAVFLNTSGGLTGGDRLSFALSLAEGTSLAATTQTAERAYLSQHGAAHLSFEAKLARGASLHWLPQETILFQGAHLDRETRVDLDQDAELLLCESLTLGRHAMGETLTRAYLTDQRFITRAGRPVWAEGLLLTPEILAEPRLLAHARAFGVLALISQGAEDALADLPRCDGARIEASGWDGRALIRIAATSGFALRRQMAALIVKLSRRALPRVWSSGGLP